MILFIMPAITLLYFLLKDVLRAYEAKQKAKQAFKNGYEIGAMQSIQAGILLKRAYIQDNELRAEYCVNTIVDIGNFK